MNYLIISEEAISLKKKRVVVLIDHNNLKRQNRVNLSLETDADAYLQNNWATLWSSGTFVADDTWLEHEEAQFKAVYRAAIRAGVQAAKEPDATLSSVSNALEALITTSERASQLSKLQTLAANATSAERERFLFLCAFLFLSKTLGDKT